MSIPPPPPPPIKKQIIDSSNSDKSFEKIIIQENNTVEYKFNDVESIPDTIPLKTIVRQVCSGYMPGKSINADTLLLSLGKLRSINQVLQDYNSVIAEDVHTEDAWVKLVRHRATDLFSLLGYQVTAKTTITVPELSSLISSIEETFKQSIEPQRQQISQGFIQFEGLGELYHPGQFLSGSTSLGSGTVKAGFYIRNSFFEEKRTLFGKEKVFHLELEYLVCFGRHFAHVRFEEVFSGWIGTKNRGIGEMPYQPLASLEHFSKRGAYLLSLISENDTPFVHYKSGGFYPHGKGRASITPSSSQGRIVLDCERGLALGHYASQGSDEVTLSMMQAAGRYKRFLSASDNIEGMLLIPTPSSPLYPIIWPSVVGFSFTIKAWGHVLVESLEPIKFNNQAFDQLVLNPQRKKLIKALVSFGGKATEANFQDIVAGKAGGSVFLLHGPPGVGKTLTAEAIAELLHRPLYYITMGELGVNAEEMEKRLGDVLELCNGWDAIALIDEADVFLEKRASGGSNDVVRNAMVCVMLRLIEYHQGILFLTTNRVLTFDPAFESRVTVALKYDHLTPEAREQVWKNLIGNLTGIKVGPLDYKKLSEAVLNGRQIKNSIRLALAMAVDEAGELTQELIEQTMEITSLGRMEMANAEAY